MQAMTRTRKVAKGKRSPKPEYSLRLEQPPQCKPEDPSVAVWADGSTTVCKAVTCAESLKMTQQRIGDTRTSPEVYWSGKLNDDHLSLRIVMRNGDSWLQAWNSTQSKQFFQLRDVSPGGIEWGRQACTDYANGKIEKPQIEIMKRTYVKLSAKPPAAPKKRPAAEAPAGGTKKKGKTEKPKPVSLKDLWKAETDEGGDEGGEEEEAVHEPILQDEPMKSTAAATAIKKVVCETTAMKKPAAPAAIKKVADETTASKKPAASAAIKKVADETTGSKKPAASAAIKKVADETTGSKKPAASATRKKSASAVVGTPVPDLPDFFFD